MDLSHRFAVPTPVEETWAHFQDIASLAECFPGAQVTSAEGDTFAGTVKVKLGPIALVYNGAGAFVEKDESAHRFVVDAKGKDKRGNGTAGAKVTLTMAPSAPGGTEVEVLTDLAVTGKPAQFGRGVMQDVSDKLLGQFVACLEQRLGDASPSVAEPPAAAPTTAASPSRAGPAPTGSGPATGDPAEAVPEDEQAPDPAPAPVRPTDGGAAPMPPVGQPGAHAARPPAATPPAHGLPRADDAIDFGSTVLPILLKTYWKYLAALVVIVVVVVVIVAL